MNSREHRSFLLKMVQDSLKEMTFARALPDRASVTAEGLRWNGILQEPPYFLLALGKGAPEMAAAMAELLPEHLFLGGLVVTKDGHGGLLMEKGHPWTLCSSFPQEAPPSPPPLVLRETAHPITDARAIAAAEEALHLLKNLPLRCTVIVLLSGGGSALFELPRPPLTLEDLDAANRLLVTCGASITEINCVRKHLSAVKGGGLLRHIFPRNCLSLLVSDVVGDPVDAIASGPTSADPTTFGDALDVLRRYDLETTFPPRALSLLREGHRAAAEDMDTPGFPRESLEETVKNTASFAVTTEVVLGNRALLDNLGRRLAQAGLHTLHLSTFVSGEAREVGRFLADIAREIRASGKPVPLPAAVLTGGETVVTLRGRGRGGPNQETALAFAIAARDLPGVTLLSLDSDGTDGPTDAAGGITDGGSFARMHADGIDPWKALADNDAYAALDAAGDLLRLGPTGTNLNDCRVLLVE